jgi:cytochrome c556
MNRKWIGFAATAALIITCVVGNGLSRAQEQEKHKDKETPLGKIMEKVQKHNLALTRATRTAASFKKSQKDVETIAADLAKLAKESKPMGEAYLKNAKDLDDPKKRQEKWDEIMDAFAKTSKDLADAAAKGSTTQKDAKDLFQVVKKTCADCHNVFRVEDAF